jgi:hypothetical protein
MPVVLRHACQRVTSGVNNNFGRQRASDRLRLRFSIGRCAVRAYFGEVFFLNRSSGSFNTGIYFFLDRAVSVLKAPLNPLTRLIGSCR